MADPTRRAVLGCVAGLTTAGCLSGRGPGGTPRRPASSPTGSISSPGTSTDRGAGITPASNRPAADHPVYLTNTGSQAYTVRVRVERAASGAVVFDGTRPVAAGTEREVYNLRRADPDGIEPFAVCGRLAGPSTGTPTSSPSETTTQPPWDCITMETSACFGSAHVTVEDPGDVRVIYAIC